MIQTHKILVLVLLLLLLSSTACSAGPGTGAEDLDEDLSEDSADDASEGVGGSSGGSTGLDSTGGTNTGGSNNTGGTDSGTGGTEPADEGCFPQWDPTKVYVYPDRVQVGEKIFYSCADDVEQGAAVVGEEPESRGWGSQYCEGLWKWESNCPSTKCEDAIVWDTEANMDFWPPVMSGTLFLFEGQVWDLEQDDVPWMQSTVCEPGSTEPETQCYEITFHLAEQCL